ncbi:MAG: HAMP domain-containing sensor histidine kinase [Gemmatimonadota bacterium]|nr:HAMP domain-containing sensor histidine kinase [Gemmatimonadota bacterium]
MSRAFHLRRPAPTSTTLLAGFLLATVVMACLLAVQAYGAARSHRATAEAVLTDYAGIAAAEYGRVARGHLSRVFDVAFDEVPRRVRPGRMPEPVHVRWDLDDAARAIRCACPSLQRSWLVFRIDLRDGSATFEGDRERDLASAVRAFARTRGASGPAERYGMATLGPSDSTTSPLLLHATVFDDDEVAAMMYGVVLSRDALTEIAEHWYTRHELLPETITRGEPGDSLVRIALSAPDRTPFFASHAGAEHGPFVADTLAPHLGGLVVRASIRPTAADRLVIGGLPSSRLPFSLALLGLTLAVGIAGLWEVRRHHQLARLREDFISSVSHELRTPLAQIRMLSELQADHKLRAPEERERANLVIAREARRLTQLVENFLHFSRAQAAGSSKPHPQPVPVAECVEEAVEAFRPLLKPDAGAVEVQAEPGVTIMGQRDALRQILSNLLDNATKYGPRGQTVRVTVHRRGTSVRILVEDEGPGIPEESRSVIWEPYRRLPRDIDSHRPGSGVGLAVVRTLVESLGGRAWVERGTKGGARFVVEIPGAADASEREHRTNHDEEDEPPRTRDARETPVGAHPAD